MGKYIGILVVIIAVCWLLYSKGIIFSEEATTSSSTAVTSADPSTSQQTVTPVSQASSEPVDHLAWLNNVKGKGISTKYMGAFNQVVRTKTNNYKAQAMDLKASLSASERDKAERSKHVPFRICFYMFKCPSSSSRLRPTYNGTGNIVIINKKTEKVYRKQSMPLKSLCPT